LHIRDLQVIFSRQITKRNMFRRVIDEKNSSVLVSKDELDHLFKYDEKRDAEPAVPLRAGDLEATPDHVLNSTFAEHAHKFAKVRSLSALKILKIANLTNYANFAN